MFVFGLRGLSGFHFEGFLFVGLCKGLKPFRAQGFGGQTWDPQPEATRSHSVSFVTAKFRSIPWHEFALRPSVGPLPSLKTLGKIRGGRSAEL